MYDDLLLPVAPGEVEKNPAVAHAVDVARTTDAEIHVVSVVDPTVYDPLTPELDRVHGVLESEAADTVDEVADRAEAAGVDVTTRIGHGPPHTVLDSYVEDAGIDLVVMATHGREALGHALLGSVTEKVVRTSDAPVLTVPLEG